MDCMNKNSRSVIKSKIKIETKINKDDNFQQEEN